MIHHGKLYEFTALRKTRFRVHQGYGNTITKYLIVPGFKLATIAELTGYRIRVTCYLRDATKNVLLKGSQCDGAARKLWRRCA